MSGLEDDRFNFPTRKQRDGRITRLVYVQNGKSY